MINTKASLASCKLTPGCDEYEPIAATPTKSLEVDRINTLHQFDTAGIVGLQSPVGKLPIVFYVKESECSGRRGILYYDDYDSICFMFPESQHAEWCQQPYDLMYDGIEEYDNGVERGIERKHGIFELMVSVWRKWYNGQIIYRPRYKIQGCGRRTGGYPVQTERVEETKVSRVSKTSREVKKTNISRGCGCKK